MITHGSTLQICSTRQRIFSVRYEIPACTRIYRNLCAAQNDRQVIDFNGFDPLPKNFSKSKTLIRWAEVDRNLIRNAKVVSSILIRTVVRRTPQTACHSQDRGQVDARIIYALP